jgi:hypothetical protein
MLGFEPRSSSVVTILTTLSWLQNAELTCVVTLHLLVNIVTYCRIVVKQTEDVSNTFFQKQKGAITA